MATNRKFVMNVAQKIKEGLSIAGVLFVAFAVIIAITIAMSRAADKIFGDQLLPRLLTVSAILSALGLLVFCKRGTAKQTTDKSVK